MCQKIWILKLKEKVSPSSRTKNHSDFVEIDVTKMREVSDPVFFKRLRKEGAADKSKIKNSGRKKEGSAEEQKRRTFTSPADYLSPRETEQAGECPAYKRGEKRC